MPESKLTAHTIYESDIDNRDVLCGCNDEHCKIGISFDSEPDIMRLTDKFGNEHAMRLNKQIAKQLIERLTEYL